MTTPFDAPDWRGMSQQDRDLGLNNGAAVAGSADIVAGWDRRSAEMRARHPSHLDLRYGPRERNRIDFLKAADKAPTLVFIHGGYWQKRAKEAFTLFAEGPMAHGINVAMIGYTLAPEATLDEIVAEIHAGIDFLAEQLPALGGDASRNRGVRLVRRRASDVDGAVAPQCQGRHGDQRHLRSRADPPQLSQRQAWARRGDVPPQLADDAGRRCDEAAVAGGRERRIAAAAQADRGFRLSSRQTRMPVSYEEIPGADHFTVMDEMASPTGRITVMIRQLFERKAV